MDNFIKKENIESYIKMLVIEKDYYKEKYETEKNINKVIKEKQNIEVEREL